MHTNTHEGYFSILKRGIAGVYQHVSQKHLGRYLGEFDFRYNERAGLGVSDAERADKALKGIEGKRLTYRRANEAQAWRASCSFLRRGFEAAFDSSRFPIGLWGFGGVFSIRRSTSSSRRRAACFSSYSFLSF